MKNILFSIVVLLCITGCDYLDIVPDDKATVEDAFKNKNEANKVLFSIYSYMPNHLNVRRNIDWIPTDEFTTSPNWDNYWFPFRDMRNGYNSASYPTFNFWSSYNSRVNYPLYDGIRQAYLFLDRIGSVPDLSAEEADRWRAEAEFLIAYYHYLLLRYYGPIVIVDKLIPLDAPKEDMYAYRTPYDECVEYLAKAFGNVAKKLPDTRDEANKGKPTRLAALSLKARILLYAASPLFNGNAEFYSDFVDNKGRHLISQTYNPDKWKYAMDAAKEAIDMAKSQNFEIYTYNGAESLSDFDKAVSNARYRMVDPWNSELIWGYTGWNENSYTEDSYQVMASPRLGDGGAPYNGVGASLAIVETFLTNKGLPIDADPDFDYTKRFSVPLGAKTANLNNNREPRYYAFIGFDGGKFEVSNKEIELKMKLKEAHGMPSNKNNYSYSGFMVKKGIHPATLFENKNKRTIKCYPFPLMRLSELYLNYIEAYVEYTGRLDGQALIYLNELRSKNGLPAWETVAPLATREITPQEIIRTERMVELSFEGHRFHDIRRWKLGEKYFNVDIQGCDIAASNSFDFWKIKSTGEEKRVFRTPQDYLLPLHAEDIKVNKNLKQNPKW